MSPSEPSIEYDPFSYEVHEDPYPIYARLREEAPAYFNERHGFWALSRFEDVRTALLDHDTYCSGLGFTIEDTGPVGLPMVLGMDPPDHTRVRGTINRALTPRRVAAMEHPIRRRAAELLDGIAPRGHADLIGELAAVLPMDVIATMLDVPPEDRPTLRGWADDMVHREDSTVGLTEKGIAAGGKFAEYFARMLDARASAPRDDLLSLLLAAESRSELSRAEILGFCSLLIIAGNETTTKLIGNVAYRLSVHSDQKRRLLEDPSLAANAVEEVMRFDTSTHMMARTLTRDVKLHGRTMRRGTKVALILASANRDPRRWERAEEFDIGRDAGGHLAFGLGIHHCLGASLARLETGIVLSEMLDRIGDFEVDLDGLERAHSGNVRGFTRVPITFTPSV